MDPSFTARLSAESFRTLACLVYEHSRIKLGPDKQPMLANRLRKRLRALGLTTYDEYCRMLHSAQAPDEIEQLVDLISTNHTRFFREPAHFTFLAGEILPGLVSQLSGKGGDCVSGPRPLRRGRNLIHLRSCWRSIFANTHR